MKARILTTLSFALLCSCTAVSDFDFQELDGSARDTSVDVDGGPIEADAEATDTGTTPSDAGAAAYLTALRVTENGASVAFEDAEFDPAVLSYRAQVGLFVSELSITATTDLEDAALSVAGTPIANDESTSVELAVGVNTLAVTVSVGEESETYSLVVNRTESAESYLKGMTDGPPGTFGWSVAMAGDLLVIGAPLERAGGESAAGAAYIFERNAASWELAARIESSAPVANARFGAAVATDGALVAVAAPFESGPDVNSGSVYVFRKVADWEESDRIRRRVEGEQFGSALAIDGRRLAVGALGVDAVYTYRLPGTTEWVEDETLIPPFGVPAGSQFGSAIVMSGDTLVIAARREGAGGTGGVNPVIDGTQRVSGAVFVYSRLGAMWGAPEYLKAFDPQADDHFGASIALGGDLLVVGAPGEDGGQAGLGQSDDDDLGSTDSGAVYTFRRNADGDWSAGDYFKAEEPVNTASYGSSVAMRDNVLFIGAPNGRSEDSEPTGVVSVYTLINGAWTFGLDLAASNADTDDGFGSAMGASEHGFVVGAPDEDGNGATPTNNERSRAGAAYFFESAP